MNVLLIGSGGREHALAWAIAASPLLGTLYCAPGNPGMVTLGTNVALDVHNHEDVITFCRQEAVGLVMVGPEAPLVAGLVDNLTAAGIKAFGPTRYAAQLEGSKGFTKDICRARNIPTAAYERFTALDAALAYAPAGRAHRDQGRWPCRRKGHHRRHDTVRSRSGAPRHLGRTIWAKASCVVEAFLEGEEQALVLSDGVNVLPLTTAQDHKRVGDGDTGPNTGGMGAYSPAPCMTPALTAEALETIVKPTVKALAEHGQPLKGVLYAGLMLTKSGPQLIEYNAHFGDPETQVLMPRLKSDLLTLLLATVDGTLDKMSVRWKDETALTVCLCAKGYPGTVTKIQSKGLEKDLGAGG